MPDTDGPATERDPAAHDDRPPAAGVADPEQDEESDPPAEPAPSVRAAEESGAAASATGETAEHDDTEHDDTEHDDTEHDDTEHDDTEHDDTEHERSGPRRGPVIALGAVAAVAVIALAVTALLTPGWLVNPGSPDAVAARATTALAARDPGELDAVSCRDQQGRPTNPFPPDALPLIRSAHAAGPARLELDTQARAPVDLTLSAAGQTQTMPADVVLGVTDGRWCMAGISERP